MHSRDTGAQFCDHKPMVRRKRLDSVTIWECRLVLPTTPFVPSYFPSQK